VCQYNSPCFYVGAKNACVVASSAVGPLVVPLNDPLFDDDCVFTDQRFADSFI
jgi:hypothetical protein